MSTPIRQSASDVASSPDTSHRTGPALEQVTLAEVAEACRVSVATASRALRGLPGMSDALRSSIEATARRLGYRPNRSAQALRSRRSHIVGLVVTNLLNASFQVIIEIIQARLHDQGYDMVVTISAGEQAEEERFVHMLLDRQVDGILMLGSKGLVPLSPLLLDPPVPVVHVVRRLSPQPAASVLADDRSGAREATAYLLGLGHERIALVTGSRDTRSGNERRLGYLDALATAGRKPERSIIVQGRYRPETGATAVARLFGHSSPPTALLLANHEATFGALPALVERGIEVPKQLSVVVYEDAPWFSHWSPPLTVVDNRPVAIAEAAVQLLLERLENGPTVVSTGIDTQPSGTTADPKPVIAGPARLIVRSSCASPPSIIW